MKMYKYLIGGREKAIVKRQLSPPNDLIFVIDSSSSVTTWEFRKGNLALQYLTSRFREDTRFAVVTIATRAKIHSKFLPIEGAGRVLQRLRRSGGKTNTQEALALCQDLFRGTNNSGARPESRRKVFVVTDGRSNIKQRQTIQNAKQLWLMKVEVFVVAVGEYLEGMGELTGMASSSDAHMYRVADADGLIRVVDLVPKTDERPWLHEIFG